MSTQTTNLQLTKPGKDDFYDIDVQNGNMDVIDKSIADHVANKSNPHGVTAEQIGAITAIINANPTVTGCSTLLEWLLSMKAKGHYSISATINDFADLPQKDWHFGLFARLQGNICVEIWKFLSGGTNILRREMNTNNQWSSDWTSTYLPLDGGTLTGILQLKKADNGYTRIYKNHSETGDYGTTILDTDKDGNMMELILRSDLKRLLFTINGVEGDVLTTHNKPKGTYKGDGSATRRLIEIGGFTDSTGVLLISRLDTTTFVTYAGGFAFDINGNTYAIPATEICYRNGHLDLSTSRIIVNEANAYFSYQVL